MAKRWLLGTHQGSVDNAHLPAYLNEFVFRLGGYKTINKEPAFSNPACSTNKVFYGDEMKKHQLGAHQPASPNGPHTQGLAFDVNISLPDGTTNTLPKDSPNGATISEASEQAMQNLADQCGITYPMGALDRVDFQSPQ